MRYQRDGFSIEAAIRKGRDLPQWYLDEPAMEPLDEFYLHAFLTLSTCRYYEGGPIPYCEIVSYGERRGLDELLVESFAYIIQAMDNRYLEWVSEQQKKNAEAM